MENFNRTLCGELSLAIIICISVFWGCGKSNGTSVTPPNNTVGGTASTTSTITTPVATVCPAGMLSIGGGPCMVGSFTQVCAANAGAITTAQGQQVCRMTSRYGFALTGTVSAFARLNPNDPAGVNAFLSSVKVFPYDKVDVTATGGWGSINYDYKNYLGGLFTVWTPNGNCNQVRVDGTSISSGTAVTNNENGKNAGLWMSDGTQAYLIGTHAKHAMGNEGLLRFGVNAPLDGTKCGNITLSSIVVEHCENSSGSSISCY